MHAILFISVGFHSYVPHVTGPNSARRASLAFRAMPPKKKCVWQPKGSAPDPRWLQGSAARLDTVRHGLDAAAAAPENPPPGTIVPGGPQPAELCPWVEGVRPRGQPTTPDEELAALRLGRTVPAAFSPQRHAVMVCGRPVVVPLLQKTPQHPSNTSNHFR